MCHCCSKNCIGCECPSVSPSGWQFLLTAVSTTQCRVTSPPSSNRRATLVTGSIYARRRWPSSMLLAPNTWPSVAVRSVQLQLICGTVCQRQCSLLSHWTFFDAAWNLNCSSILTTGTAPVKRLYCCVTHCHFPATLKSSDYNVAITFILNNNNNTRKLLQLASVYLS